MPEADTPVAVPLTMSLREYARRMGVSYTSVKRQSSNNKIVGHVRFGRRVLVSIPAVEKQLAAK